MPSKYDCPVKENSLRRIWFSMYEATSVAGGAVGCLPSSRSFEPLLVSSGNPSRIYLFDYKPAVLANCTRRPALATIRHKLKSVAGDCASSCEKLAASGVRLKCFHVDFMGSIEGLSRFSVRGQAERIARSGIMAQQESFLAFTFFKGREQFRTTRLLNQMTGISVQALNALDSSGADRIRLLHAAVQSGMRARASIFRAGKYKNMLWVIFKIQGETK